MGFSVFYVSCYGLQIISEWKRGDNNSTEGRLRSGYDMSEWIILATSDKVYLNDPILWPLRGDICKCVFLIRDYSLCTTRYKFITGRLSRIKHRKLHHGGRLCRISTIKWHSYHTQTHTHLEIIIMVNSLSSFRWRSLVTKKVTT